MSDNTFHITNQDVRKQESQKSKFHGGNIPKDSDTAALKQMMADSDSQSSRIERVKANLPLPEQPVGGKQADLQSADARTVDGGSGGVNAKLGTESSNGLREPATAESSARVDGEATGKSTAS